MKNLSLQMLLKSIVVVLCLTSFAVGGLGISSIRTMQHNSGVISSHTLPAVRLLGELNSDTLNVRLAVRRLLQAEKPEAIDRELSDIRAAENELRTHAENYKQLMTGPEERANWATFETSGEILRRHHSAHRSREGRKE